ncbi:MAG TPA: bestrophin family ion channel [Saprospiraceae bacterium]|nr:bestrophin family ion channel [Saprospiraceae bacterium]HMQ84070.1 bestrophin family ion channel [Saprospiraceae bacterium]
MIYYKTNDNWFGDVQHLARSWTMVRIMRSVLLIGVYATMACFLVIGLDLGDYIFMDVSIFSMLGVLLSIFLVFRTNASYDRWWEGRKQWGALVNNTRNLAIYVESMFPKANHQVRHDMAKHISNFCIALVDHLRDGTKLDKLIYLSEQDIAEYQTKGHIPNHIALQLFEVLAEAHRSGEINEGDYINIKAQHQSLLDILGACERIKKTPIPFSYAVYLKIFITAYGVILPFALVNTFHFLSIPIAMFVFFALLGVELLGEEIEDPFGLDCNDLPTGDIAHTIKTNVFEILLDRSGIGHTKEKELYEKVF